MKHWETHPDYVEGCFACRITQVAFSATCTPGRRYDAAYTSALERQWGKDMPAYKRLVESGVQPPRIDGAAQLEKHAEHRLQVEMGALGDARRFAEGERLTADLGVVT